MVDGILQEYIKKNDDTNSNYDWSHKIAFIAIVVALLKWLPNITSCSSSELLSSSHVVDSYSSTISPATNSMKAQTRSLKWWSQLPLWLVN